MSFRVGKIAGLITFLVSAAAFFAMLVIQFTAGGQLLAPLLKITYIQAVLVVGAVACSYLVIGGFRTVLATDVIQGVARFLLLPIIIYALSNLNQAQSIVKLEALPLSVWVSFVLTGIFSAAASADVWQRIYAAKSNNEARYGLLFGGAIILAFGAILIELGLTGSATGVINSPETGFQDILQAALPTWVSLGAVFLVLCTVVGTADTEIFLLAGMLRSEFSKLTSVDFGVPFVRAMVFLVTIVGITVACFVTNLVQLYSWLLSAVMTISPFVLLSIFRQGSDRIVALGMGLVVSIFAYASYVGLITLDNAYYIILPGTVVASIIFAKSGGGNERNQAKARNPRI
jgi:Na+/proline symporter